MSRIFQLKSYGSMGVIFCVFLSLEIMQTYNTYCNFDFFLLLTLERRPFIKFQYTTVSQVKLKCSVSLSVWKEIKSKKGSVYPVDTWTESKAHITFLWGPKHLNIKCMFNFSLVSSGQWSHKSFKSNNLFLVGRRGNCSVVALSEWIWSLHAVVIVTKGSGFESGSSLQ